MHIFASVLSLSSTESVIFIRGDRRGHLKPRITGCELICLQQLLHSAFNPFLPWRQINMLFLCFNES